MKISELKNGSRGVEVEGVLVKKSDPRTVFTRFGKTEVSHGELEDETGRIELVLWGEDTGIPEGSRVKVTNGFVSSFRGTLQLSAGRYGKIEVLE